MDLHLQAVTLNPINRGSYLMAKMLLNPINGILQKEKRQT